MEEGKRFIGMFHTEAELLAKVGELKAEGYKEHQIFVIAKSENDVKMLQSRTDAEIQTTHESWLDKFMDFMTGEDRVRSMMDNLGFSEDEKAGFYQDVNNGSMLLYVEESSAMLGHSESVGAHFGIGENAGDPNLGANTWVEPPGGAVTRTPEQPAFGDTAPVHTEDHVTPVHEAAFDPTESDVYVSPVHEKPFESNESHTHVPPVHEQTFESTESHVHVSPVHEGSFEPTEPDVYASPVHKESFETAESDIHASPVHERPIERSEFSVAADDTITNGLETTDFAGDLGMDPEQEQRRQQFQNEINNGSQVEQDPLTALDEHDENKQRHNGLYHDPLDKKDY